MPAAFRVSVQETERQGKSEENIMAYVVQSSVLQNGDDSCFVAKAYVSVKLLF
jgi:hypothetical protein